MLRRRRWTHSIRTLAAGQLVGCRGAGAAGGSRLARMQALLWVLALAASQEHGRRPLHERRRRPVRDKTARQQAAAARARARGYMEAVETPRITEDLTEPATEIAATTLTEAQRQATPTLEKLPINDQRRACSAACTAEGKGTVYAQHLRKAGGTLLRQYLARYRCKPFDTIVSKRQRLIQRGVPRSRTRPIRSFKVKTPSTPRILMRPSAVYVTILRDPISRVASAFFAEDGIHFDSWLDGVQRASQERAKDADNVPLYSESVAPRPADPRGGFQLLRAGILWCGVAPCNSKTFRCGRVHLVKFRRRAHLGTFEHAGRSKGGHESLGEGAAPPIHRALPAVHTAAAREFWTERCTNRRSKATHPGPEYF